MKTQIRWILVTSALLAAMVLSGCDHYNCSSGATFGNTTCASTTTGIGTGGASNPDSAFVFVADPAGTIDGYTLDVPAQTFAATTGYTAPSTPVHDIGVGVVVAQEQYLYTGYPSTNQIFGWAIGAGGTLTSLSGSPYSASFMSLVPSGFGTQSIAVNPAGTLLFFSTTGSNNPIYVYQIGAGGALTEVNGSPFSSPASGNLATDGLGQFLYVTDAGSNHTGSQIAAFSIQSTGALAPVSGSPFPYNMWQVQGEPTGKYLIGTTGTSVGLGNGADNDFLYVFSIASSGAITELAPVATSFSPLAVVVAPESGGNLIYSLSVSDSDLSFNPIEAFSLSSGSLTPIAGEPFSGVASGDVGTIDQNGAYLFVNGGAENPTTHIVTYQLGALNVSSVGALSQITPEVDLPNGGFFAVTDPQ